MNSYQRELNKEFKRGIFYGVIIGQIIFIAVIYLLSHFIGKNLWIY
jgi:tetrahydromethanopterin S-methyltransferase subunit G